MHLKPGTKLGAASTTAQFIVIRSPEAEIELTCAGEPLTTPAPTPASLAEGEPMVVGKRYTTPDSALELLCTAAGSGPLLADGVELGAAQAKQLPSSD